MQTQLIANALWLLMNQRHRSFPYLPSDRIRIFMVSMGKSKNRIRYITGVNTRIASKRGIGLGKQTRDRDHTEQG